MKRMILAFLIVFYSFESLATGLTNWSVPTRIDTIRNDGIMVFGSFGNPADCAVVNQFFVAVDHPQYKEIYSKIMTAFVASKRIQVYIHACGQVGWYRGDVDGFNVLKSYGAINITN